MVSPAIYTLPLPYFGSIYFYAVLFQKKHVIDLGEHYRKQTMRNRCEILNDQGVLKLSIPVIKKGNDQRMLDARIDWKDDWFRDHPRSIMAAYGSSPFYEYYKDDLHPLYQNHGLGLTEFNIQCHEAICRMMEWDLPLQTTESYIEKSEWDKRPLFDKKHDEVDYQPYTQVFNTKKEHVKNLSILDLIFNLGPESEIFLHHVVV